MHIVRQSAKQTMKLKHMTEPKLYEFKGQMVKQFNKVR